MDELLNTAREKLNPPWDEVREARVLHRVLEATAEEDPGEEATVGGQGWYQRGSRFWFSASALAVASVLVVLWGVSFAQRSQLSSSEKSAAVDASSVGAPPTDNATERASAENGAPAPVGSAGEASVSELTFSPGTRALLDPGAHVTTLTHTEEKIELRQASGRVAYEVNPDRHQSFEVLVEHVVVHVVGTAFSVEATSQFVSVAVRRGVVSVRDGERTLLLKPGEDLRISLTGVDDQRHAPGKTSANEAQGESTEAPSQVVDRLMKEADAARQRGE